MAAVVGKENTGVKIAVGAVVCKDCELIGDIFIGAKTVVHTKARIIAEAGPIIIGENNLIEEQAQIINRLSTEENVLPDARRMTIGNNNVFEVGSVSEALKIGDDNILESKARVGHLTELTNGCVIGAKCEVTIQETIPENTIIYGEKHHRRQQVCRPTAQTLQLDFLTRILPNYHYIRKPNVKPVKTEPEKGINAN